ncbi:MAG TPA: ABC transporter permease [Elusimicrobiota bacterium]|nr:ABC transporter permease [Elusimicrobiota bacterium]
MPFIELKNITRAYQVGGDKLVVLKGINLNIEEGEFVAIMGPSGSGKSTLMQILGLLDRPTSGKYFLFGRDVSRLTDDEGAALRSKTIGFIFQMFNLLARTSAMDNVILPMIYAGSPNREARGRELLATVGLSDRMAHKPNELSGGQQQRVAVARALVNSPRVIFADEPTGNLASDQAEDILRQLKLMNRAGITVIMVTHEPDIAAHARRIIHIKDGAITSDKTSGEDSGEDASPSGGGSAVLASPKTALPAQIKLQHGGLNWVEMGEYWASALRAVTANKVRSALSMLGILIGVAAVIAMLAIGKGAQQAIEARISRLGSNLVMVWPFSQAAFHGGTGSYSRLTLQDLDDLSQVSPHVVAVDGELRGSVQAVYQDKNTSTEVQGDLPSYAGMYDDVPYYGRFFTSADNDSMARVAVLGQTVVNALFGNQNPVGKTVKLNRVAFTVIGILPPKGSSGWHDQDDVIVVPLKTAMMRLGLTAWGGGGSRGRYLSTISLECDSPNSIDGVMSRVESFLRARHHLPSYKEDDFTVRNMADIQAALTGTTKTFTLLLGIVAAISLLVGGIGIMNIMLVSVSERTREIGLRKAVGAARRAILIQFLLESAVLSTLGGVIGITLGVGFSLALSHFAGWAAIVQPQAVIMAFVFSAGVGIVFGFWPARKASLLSPIEALRYE